MIQNIRSLGHSLSNIRDAIGVHSTNIANVNTEGYVAKSGGFSTIKPGGGVKFHERSPSAKSVVDSIQLFESKSKVELKQKIATLHELGVMPLDEQTSHNMVKAISDLNYSFDINTPVDNQVAINAAAGTIQAVLDDYSAKVTSWSTITGYEPTNKVIGSGELLQGYNNLEASFEAFKQDVNDAFGTNVITGSMNSAVIDKTAIGKPLTSVTDNSLSYNVNLAVVQNRLNSEVDFAQDIYNYQQDAFQNEHGVNLEEEVAKTLALQNQYDAVAQLIRVQDEMFQTLLNITA